MKNPKELEWIDAIVKVLREEKRAMHYVEITEMIIDKQYRSKVGATPTRTVSYYITTNINTAKDKSLFSRVGRGEYILNEFGENIIKVKEKPAIEKEIESPDENLLIESMGIFWNRELINWKPDPDVFGVQLFGAKEVNFGKQIGIYLLHDIREIIYVGQAIEQPIGKRLYQHTNDRFSGRWNRFSWFGFYGVNDIDGSINFKETNFKNITISSLADTIEAILIESIEPRQNRKKGNTFAGIEYIQQEDPEIKRKRDKQIIKDLLEKNQ